MDPWHRKTQQQCGFELVSLDAAQRDGDVKAWVANDHRSTPADHAAFLIDFQEWLSRLSGRRRLSAELLSQGFGTLEVAREVGLTPGAITQARAALARSWNEFQQDQTA
jgi:hypothetical protein